MKTLNMGGRVASTLLALGVFFAFNAASAVGSVYYVNTLGSDTCDGSTNTEFATSTDCAFATIGHAVDIATDGDTINIATGEYLLDSQIRITEELNIVGTGDSTIITKGITPWTNTTGSKGLAPIITVVSGSKPVILENFKVTGAANIAMVPSGNDFGHGLNVVSSSNVTLNNITSVSNAAAGLIVNSSNVVANNLNTSANGWYGVNVDKADSGAANFTLNGGAISESVQIISDKSADVTVNAAGYTEYKIAGGIKTLWSTQQPTNTAVISRDGVNTLYSTIQSAVNTASTTVADTIVVSAGTYDEQIVINKSLSLQGAGNTTIIKPSQTTANSFQLFNRTSGGAANTAGIMVTNIQGGTVNISNLKVDGSLITSTPSDSRLIGILYRDSAAGLLNQLTVQGIGINEGNGILLAGFGTPTSVEVSNSTVTDYRKNGITANFAGMNANIHHNVITGNDPVVDIAQNGIQIGFGAQGTITHNTVNNNFWTGTYGGTNNPVSDPDADGATGILLYMPGSSLIQVNNNIISGNQFGISSVAAGEINISNNDITGRAHTGNGFPTGVAIYSADMWTDDFGGTEMSTIATISNNQIKTVEYGLLVKDYVDGGAAPVVVAPSNWWGTAVGADIALLIVSSSTINYEPWFTDGLMTSLAYNTTNSSTSVTVTVSTEINTSLTSTSGNIDVTIPADTIITGPVGWNGVFDAPALVESFVFQVAQGTTQTLNEVVELGSDTVSLTFNTPVKIVFSGKAGQRVGWAKKAGDNITEITNVCENATNPTVAENSECAISTESDLIVWTRHATAFMAYTQSTAGGAATTGGTASSGGTGGFASQIASQVANANSNVGQVLGVATGTPIWLTGTTTPDSFKNFGQLVSYFARNLRFGMKGDDVTSLQALLIAQGHLRITKPTGYFGILTRNAVVKWQRANGLPATGYFGPMSRKVVNPAE